MLHLQKGDIDAATATYEILHRGGRVIAAYARLDQVLFWSIVAERRGDFDNAAILASFADALAAAASLARLVADVRIIEASRRVVEEALGSERYIAQYQRGPEMNWDELPLLKEAARASNDRPPEWPGPCDGVVPSPQNPLHEQPKAHRATLRNVTSDNPFLPPPEDRDQTRRFRGRLAAPVTLVTAGEGPQRAGLTVSSLFVNEGDPGEIHMVIGPLTDLWEALTDTSRCVIHVADGRHTALAGVFAGLRPSPGGIFAGSETTTSEWGPVLVDLPTRAYGTVVSMEERGWSGVVMATVDHVDIADLDDPLIHFRGAYRHLR